MIKNKQVVIISPNVELLQSFKRALNSGSGRRITAAVTCEDLSVTHKDESCLLIDSIAENDSEQAAISLRMNIWSNPILNLIAAQKEEEKFEDPGLFYVKIPFALNDLIDKIDYSEAISKEDVIAFMIQWLSKESHDIRNMLNNPVGRSKCVGMINHVFASLQISSTFPEDFVSKKEALLKMLIASSINKEIISNAIMDLFQEIERHLEKEDQI
jgi:hypothetical protein